jgi:hypothetical protein
MRFAVCVDDLSDQKLEFFGWTIVKRSEEFIVYQHLYDGDEQIVDAKGRKFLFVDDYNDAQQMGHFIITLPDLDA